MFVELPQYKLYQVESHPNLLMPNRPGIDCEWCEIDPALCLRSHDLVAGSGGSVPGPQFPLAMYLGHIISAEGPDEHSCVDLDSQWGVTPRI